MRWCSITSSWSGCLANLITEMPSSWTVFGEPDWRGCQDGRDFFLKLCDKHMFLGGTWILRSFSESVSRSQALFDVSGRNQYIDRFQDQAVCTQATYNGHHRCLQILPYASSIWSNRHTMIPILLHSFLWVSFSPRMVFSCSWKWFCDSSYHLFGTGYALLKWWSDFCFLSFKDDFGEGFVFASMFKAKNGS